ncbi:MAG: T9SS type A sorting domain-containing protein [bacterium]|nr:T9SS type A sorting domain-containing protein [bacterium]
MKRILISLLLVAFAATTAPAATLIVINSDGAGEGFNDTTPATPVGGNTGTTVGQQRLNLFQHAADIWGGLIDSDVTIRVTATFDPLSCDASGAVLGAAGPVTVYRDFTGAEWPGTWYHVALANKRYGSDLAAGNDDIRAQFNSSIDNNNNCLSGTNWYYGFDGNEGTDVELLPVLLHEFGHGLGFSTFVDEADGTELAGYPDTFERHILDTTTGIHWHDMNDSQRMTSAINTGNLVWDGSAVTGAAPYVLGGKPTLQVNSGTGLPATMDLGSASFGPALDAVGITGDVVLVDDGTGVVTDGCSGPFVNAAAIAGNIALIDRGTCAFTDKAQNAEAAGAIAVIIVDNSGGATPPGLGGTDPGLTIPTVSVTTADGALIKAALPGVNVTLFADTAILQGADSLGRVKLYAPNPIEPGSSISHWDITAFPDVLMEPAINSALSTDVDLTLQHFDDIGWFDPRVSATPDVPAPTALGPNYPNPFNPATTIAFRLAQPGQVDLRVFNAAGRLVRTLVSGQMTDGDHLVSWQGRDDGGRQVASGVYFYRLQANGYDESRRMVLMK